MATEYSAILSDSSHILGKEQSLVLVFYVDIVMDLLYSIDSVPKS